MKNGAQLSRMVILSLALSWPLHSRCQQGQGGVPVRVVQLSDDATLQSKCINPSKDRVWLTLRRVVTTKNKGWFIKDDDVSIVINAHVQTDPPQSNGIAYPLAAKAKFGEGPTGQVSVPIEYAVVSGLTLSQNEKDSSGNKIVYTGLGVDVTMLNTKKRNGLGSALQALVDITSSSKLPIPASPYTQAATYLLGYANKAVDTAINGTSDNDKAVTGSMAFNFDPQGTCGSKDQNGDDFESTGTKAFLSSDGIKTPAAGSAIYVDINQTNNFCWTADLTPSFVLKATPKSGATSCTDASYTSKYLPVSNNYLGFFLNKRAVSATLGATNPLATRDRQESLKRCKANGIKSAIACPGGR
jgi:hypothetical protein